MKGIKEKPINIKTKQNLTFKINLTICFLFFTIFLLPFNFLPLKTLTAKASQYTTYKYAQIASEDVYLYKSTSSTTPQNAYFCLPATYFVLLLSNIDENFYKAQYQDIVGYVLKSEVNPVKEKPKTPYLENITFRVYSSDGTNLFASPFNTSSPNIVGSVEVLESLTYYGEILGDEFIESRGFSWYYCKTNSGQKGYLYKGLCDNLSIITPNTEVVTFIDQPFLDDDDGYLYNLVDVTPALKFLLILLICAPSGVLIFLLFKPFKLEKQKVLSNKTQNKNSTQNKNFKKQNKTKLSRNFFNKKSKHNKQKLKNQTLNKIQRIIDDEPL